jgi:hypothetical protein
MDESEEYDFEYENDGFNLNTQTYSQMLKFFSTLDIEEESEKKTPLSSRKKSGRKSTLSSPEDADAGTQNGTPLKKKTKTLTPKATPTLSPKEVSVSNSPETTPPLVSRRKRRGSTSTSTNGTEPVSNGM